MVGTLRCGVLARKAGGPVPRTPANCRIMGGATVKALIEI